MGPPKTFRASLAFVEEQTLFLPVALVEHISGAEVLGQATYCIFGVKI